MSGVEGRRRVGKGAERAVPTFAQLLEGVGTPLRGFAHPTG